MGRTNKITTDLRAAKEALTLGSITKREFARSLGIPQSQVSVTLSERAYCSERQAGRFREAARDLAKAKLERLQGAAVFRISSLGDDEDEDGE